MKKVGILLLFLMCNALFTHAQKETATKTDQREYLIAQIEKSINDIRKDLQEKKLQYNYELIDKYLILCEKNNQIVGINKEPQLAQIIFVIKPQEIDSQRETYEKAKEELQKLLKSYPEYVYFRFYTKKSNQRRGPEKYQNILEQLPYPACRRK